MSTGIVRSLASTCVMAALLVACDDDSTVRENSTHAGAPASTAPASGAYASLQSRERLHRRNPHDWVGPAHNKMIDDFRREVRKPGLVTSNICEYVITFSMSNERLPGGRTFEEGANWRALRAVSDSSPLCGRARGTRASTISLRSPLEALSAFVAPQSSTVYSLMDEVEAAVNNASDSDDLANRLNSILDRAASLSALEQDALSATASIAQSSFEYWQDQYLPFEEEIIAEYSPCVEEQLSYGYNDPVGACVSGKDGSAYTSRDPLRGNRAQRLVATRLWKPS